jgi:hypothetical protein
MSDLSPAPANRTCGGRAKIDAFDPRPTSAPARQETRQAESRRRIFPGSASLQRVAIDFAGPANEIIGVGARGEYCGSGHDKKGKRASQEN